MIDNDVVAVSPSRVFRVLSDAGRLRRWVLRPSKRSTGVEQPVNRTSIGTPISRTSIFTALLLLVRRAGGRQPVLGGVGYSGVDEGGEATKVRTLRAIHRGRDRPASAMNISRRN
jgi:hypothetical protein